MVTGRRGVPCVLYRNTESLHYAAETDIAVQVNDASKTNKLTEKATRFVVTRGEEWKEGELNKGGQNAQASRYKRNKY